MKTSLWFSWLILLIAAAALCLTIVRCEPIEADWAAVLVGALAALVTLLVGWQIFSNIKEREKIEQLTEDNRQFQNNMNSFRDDWEEKIKTVEKCCQDRKSEIVELNNKIDSVNNASLLIVSAKGLIKSARFDDKESKPDATLISMAYSSLFQALYQFIKSKADKRNIWGCISELKTCIMMLSYDNLQFAKEHYDRGTKLYHKIKNLIHDKNILSELFYINKAQEKIGWNQELEKIHDLLAKLNNEQTE